MAMSIEEINNRIKELTREIDELRKEKKKIETRKIDFNYCRGYLRKGLKELKGFYKQYNKNYDDSNHIYYVLHNRFRQKAKTTEEYIGLVDSFVEDEKKKVAKRLVRDLNYEEYDKYFFKEEKVKFDTLIRSLIDDLYEEYREESVIIFMTESYDVDKTHVTKSRVYSEKVKHKYNGVFERLKKKALSKATNGLTNKVANDERELLVSDEDIQKAKAILKEEIDDYFRRLVSHL